MSGPRSAKVPNPSALNVLTLMPRELLPPQPPTVLLPLPPYLLCLALLVLLQLANIHQQLPHRTKPYSRPRMCRWVGKRRCKTHRRQTWILRRRASLSARPRPPSVLKGSEMPLSLKTRKLPRKPPQQRQQHRPAQEQQWHPSNCLNIFFWGTATCRDRSCLLGARSC